MENDAMRFGLVIVAAALAASRIAPAEVGSPRCLVHAECVELVNGSLLEDPTCDPRTTPQTDEDVRSCMSSIPEILKRADAPRGVQAGVDSVKLDVIRNLVARATGVDDWSSRIGPLLRIYVQDLDGPCESLAQVVKDALADEIRRRCDQLREASSVVVRLPNEVEMIDVFRAAQGEWSPVRVQQAGECRIEGRPGEEIKVRVPCFRLKDGGPTRRWTFSSAGAEQPAVLDLLSELEARLTLNFSLRDGDRLKQVQYGSSDPRILADVAIREDRGVQSVVACYPGLDDDVASGKRIAVAIYGSGPSFSSQAKITQEIELREQVVKYEVDLVGDRLPLLYELSVGAEGAEAVRKVLQQRFPGRIGEKHELDRALSPAGRIPEYRSRIKAPQAFAILLLRATGSSNVKILLVYHALPLPDTERLEGLPLTAVDQFATSRALANLEKELSLSPPPFVERDLRIDLVDLEVDMAYPPPTPGTEMSGTSRVWNARREPFKVGDVVMWVYATQEAEPSSLSRIRALQQQEPHIRRINYGTADAAEKVEIIEDDETADRFVILDPSSLPASTSLEALMFALWRAADAAKTPTARCAALLNLYSLHESYSDQTANVVLPFRRESDVGRECGGLRDMVKKIQERRTEYSK